MLFAPTPQQAVDAGDPASDGGDPRSGPCGRMSQSAPLLLLDFDEGPPVLDAELGSDLAPPSIVGSPLFVAGSPCSGAWSFSSERFLTLDARLGQPSPPEAITVRAIVSPPEEPGEDSLTIFAKDKGALTLATSWQRSLGRMARFGSSCASKMAATTQTLPTVGMVS